MSVWPEALDGGALVLHPHLQRVEGLAHVGDHDVAHDGDVPGLLVDLGLDGRAVELEERRRAAEGMAGLGLLARLPHPDELATEPPEARRPAPRGWG